MSQKPIAGDPFSPWFRPQDPHARRRSTLSTIPKKAHAATAPALPVGYKNPLEDPCFFKNFVLNISHQSKFSDTELASIIKYRDTLTSQLVKKDHKFCACKLKSDGTVQRRKCEFHGDSADLKACYELLIQHIKLAPASCLAREMSTIGLILALLLDNGSSNAFYWIAKSLSQRSCIDADIAQSIAAIRSNASDKEFIRRLNKTFSDIYADNLLFKLSDLADLKPGDEMECLLVDNNYFQYPFETGFDKVGQIICRKEFPSKQKPILVDIDVLCDDQNACVRAGSVILKRGDNLQQDVACLSAFHIMNSLWKKHNVGSNECSVEAKTYGCVALGPDFGVIEYIDNCVSLNEYKGDNLSHDQFTNLICTAAGSYMACFILGVRDRHCDNILINLESHDLFHIDFGYILGKSVFPLDTARFAIPLQLREMLSYRWEFFVAQSVRAFEVLRENSEDFIETCVLLFSAVATREEVETHLRKSLLMDLGPVHAATEVRRLLIAAPRSLKTRLKNTMHKVAQNIK